jgi:hypothetical protein
MTMHRTFEPDAHLPRWAYRLLALAAAAIGVACSAITAKFFILGLERTESDGLAREALIAAGVLMIVVELAAFGLSALLPRERLQALRWRLIVTGAALVAFEIATLYAVQVTLVRGADAAHQGASRRIAHLEASIAQNRQAAAALVATGARSGQSVIAASRADGAQALREASRIEQRNADLSAELARLQADQRPTLTTVLGEDGMIGYAVARGVLIVGMGLVMFAAAGALLRAGRNVPATTTAAAAQVPAARSGYAHGLDAAPAGVPTALPSTARRWLAAGVPLAALPAAFAAPSVTVTSPAPTVALADAAGSTVTPTARTAPAPTVTADTTAQAATVTNVSRSKRRAAPRQRVKVEVGSKRDSGVGELDGHRYRRIVASVRAGRLTPSVRAIQRSEGGGTVTVRAYLQQMEREGVIKREGRGYALCAAPVDPRQMDLIGGAA